MLSPCWTCIGAGRVRGFSPLSRLEEEQDCLRCRGGGYLLLSGVGTPEDSVRISQQLPAIPADLPDDKRALRMEHDKFMREQMEIPPKVLIQSPVYLSRYRDLMRRASALSMTFEEITGFPRP